MPKLSNAIRLAAAFAFGALAASAASAEPLYDGKAGGKYYLLDVSSGAVLFNYDGDRRILPASMTKMVTAYVAFDLIKQRKLSLDTQFTMPPALWRQWNNKGSTMFIRSGQSVRVADLLHGVITLSGNDASALLAHGIAGSEAEFAKLMNAAASDMGLEDSHFANAKGWPDGGKTYSSARDLAIIADRTLRDFPDLYKQFYASRSFRFNGITQSNRNPILGVVEGADGLKTGHTNEAGYGFTGSAVQNGRRLIVVVAGMPTNGDRVAESVRLLNWGFAETHARRLFKAKAAIATAQVQGGTSPTVPLITHHNIGASFMNGVDEPIKLSVRYSGPLRAPIQKNARVATLSLTYTTSGKSVSFPLYAANSVDEGNALHRIRDGFLRLFN